MHNQIENRKSDHIRICLEESVEARGKTTGLEDVFLVHNAISEINREEIDLSTKVFNHKFSAPIIVEAMTGGTTEANKINASIAQAVDELGLGMGVGSQRVAIENTSLESSFVSVREKAPETFLIANIGGSQIADGYGVKMALKAIEMIKADALAIHLNTLQEAIQPEGETNYRGVLNKIGEITQSLSIPIIVKETGAGIASEEARKLEEIGVTGINVAGAGGTSWAAVEYYRAKKVKDDFRQRLGKTFWNWGIPTAVSLVEVAQSVHLPIISSGGIRSGVDVAKSLALGADLTGIALPVLLPATRNSEEVKKMLRFLIEELKNAMFLSGADSIKALDRVPLVITGKTFEWLKTRGFQPELYAIRKNSA